MNITAQAISKWENDISYPDLPLTKTLADLLGCTVDELMHGEVNYPVATDASEERIMDRILTIEVVVWGKDSEIPKTEVKFRIPVSAVLKAYRNGTLEKLAGTEASDIAPAIGMIEEGITGDIVNVKHEDTTVKITVSEREN